MVKTDISLDHLQLVLGDLPEDGVLLEWGSGGSTRWFGENMSRTQQLYSIEHDRAWWHEVIPEVSGFGNVNLWLYEPTVPFPDGTYGTPFRENPAFAAKYISGKPVLEVLARADVVFVDGICRSSCLAMAANTCPPGTPVYIHDAPPRDWYEWPNPMFTLKDTVPPAEGHPHGMTRFLV